MTTTLIKNAAWVVAWDAGAGRHVYLNDADVAFTDGTLTHVGPSFIGTADRTIDGRGRMVMPGLVNIHAHPSSEPMSKGFMDEVGSAGLYMSSLYEYMPLFRPDPEGVKACVLVALSELLLSGVTTVADLSMAHDGWLDILGESGIRACVAPMYRSARWYTSNGHEVRYEWNEAAGREAFDNALRLIDLARQHPSGRLFGMVCPAQIDTCSAELLNDSIAVARERNVPFQLHAAQSVVEFQEITRRHGKTPIQWLEQLGVLGPSTIIGHGIFLDHHSWVHWPTRRDLDLLADTGTSVAHCPTVFQRRGITLQSAGAYLRRGINLGLGTDTYPHNLLEEIRSAAYLSRTTAGDVGDIRTTDLFNAATLGGAKALGRDDIGRLAPGMRADLAIVDVTLPAMRPLRDPIRSLVYAAAERAVRDVFVDGLQVVDNGRVTTLDYPAAAEALEEAQRRAESRVPGIDYAGRTHLEVSPLTFDRA
ncbi:MAG TPA: amidohydrolase family protein [Stellaceae bacterium]|nr:amidohydrolase family protein [Stellaceae bacterium]